VRSQFRQATTCTICSVLYTHFAAVGPQQTWLHLGFTLHGLCMKLVVLKKKIASSIHWVLFQLLLDNVCFGEWSYQVGVSLEYLEPKPGLPSGLGTL